MTDDFNEILDLLDKEYKLERERRIKWNEDNKEPPPLTETEILIHKRSDELLGNYPMTKDRLLELVELIPNGLMYIDFYGNMTSAKLFTKLFLHTYAGDMDSEQIYMNYLKSVKPYIQLK